MTNDLIMLPLDKYELEHGLVYHMRRKGLPVEKDPRCVKCGTLLIRGSKPGSNTVDGRYCGLHSTRGVKRMAAQVLLLLLSVIITSPLYAQGGNIGSNSSPTTTRQGVPLPGVMITVCQPGAITAAQVTSNIAVLTMATNPVTAGYTARSQILISGFTGGDTYLNAGTYANAQITGGAIILSVTPTTITFSLNHANATATSTGTALQEGAGLAPCAGLSSVYQDPALTIPVTQPFQSSQLGNWNVFAAPGVYYAQFYAQGVATTLRQYAIGCVPNGGIGSGCGSGAPSGPNGTMQIQAGGSLGSGHILDSGGVLGASEPINAPAISKVLYVDGTVYTSVSAAAAACPTNGCTIFDALPETFSSQPFDSVAGPVRIYATGQWLTNVTLDIPAEMVITGVGHQSSGTNYGWGIKAGPSFPINSPLVQLGNPSSYSAGTRLEDVSIDCNSVTGSYAVLGQSLAEESGLRDFTILNCPGSTAYPGVTAPIIDINGGMDQYFSIIHGDINTSAGSSITSCIYMHGAARPATVGPLTCNSGTGTQGDGVLIDNSYGGLYINIHGEHLQNTIHLGLPSGSSGVGAQGQTIIDASGAPTIANSAVTIDNSATDFFTIQNAEGVGGPCTIKDVVNNRNQCDEVDSLYESGTGTSATYITGSPNIGQIIPIAQIGSISTSFKIITGAYTVTPNDSIIGADNGPYAVTFPVGGVQGQHILLQNGSVGTQITINCSGGSLFGPATLGYLQTAEVTVFDGSCVSAPGASYRGIQVSGGSKFNPEPFLNILGGTTSCADNPTNSSTDCTFSGGGGSSFYQTVQSAGTGLPQQPILNFGTGSTCVNNVGATRTDCTFSGSGLSGLTTNYMIKAGSSTTGVNSLCDEGVTLANYMTCNEGISSLGDGVHPGIAFLLGNTTAPSPPANTAGWVGPNTGSFTAYGLQLPSVGPSGSSLLCAGALSGAISPITFCANTAISGLTPGFFTESATSSTIQNSPCDDAVTNTGDITCTKPLVVGGSGTIADITTKTTNQGIEIFSNNGSNLPGGVGIVAVYNIQPDGTTFSALPTCNSAAEGMIKKVTDSTTNTWGATITGGGSDHVGAYCDGSNWTVYAK